MRHLTFPIDWWLLIPVVFLLTISLTVLYSIHPQYLFNQLFALGVSVFAFFILSQIAYRDFRHFSVLYYLTTLVLLFIIYIIGFESRGAVRWVEIFGVSLQASEIGKPLMSLSFAGFFADRTKKRLHSYILSFVFLIPVLFLIYLQPDLGNALLYLGVWLASIVITGAPLWWLVIGAIPVAVAFPFLWNIIHEYQRQRILTFFNPMQDPRGSSYNVIQAIIAVGSGGFFGRGIDEGTQSRLKFLPENHTDFIFASLAEKLGFFGSIIIIFCFVFLLYRMYVIFTHTADMFGKVFIICAFLFISLQFFINVGMNLGLVPVVGITLPFVSYGGSSLVANFMILGILSSISVRNKKEEVLEIK